MDPLRRLHPVEPGHVAVHEHHIRQKLNRELHRLFTALSDTDDLDPLVLAEQRAQRLREEAMIVCD